jgi:mannose-6-phosphate isomerase-like protein (cupin superfamily)
MVEFETISMHEAEAVRAPDGSKVLLLGRVRGAGTAVFELNPGEAAKPVRHPRVEEVWFVVAGSGRIWRKPVDGDDREDLLQPGISITIPQLTAFQFRCDGPDTLQVLGVTSPPWGGEEDAELLDNGRWDVVLHDRS